MKKIVAPLVTTMAVAFFTVNANAEQIVYLWYNPYATHASQYTYAELASIHPFWFPIEHMPITDISPDNSLSAQTIVNTIGVGWNLGNTLDAHPHGDEAYMGPDVSLYTLETLWGNSVTTFENIEAIANSGFNTIRIPITWYNKLYDWDSVTIRSDWMNRVQQIVDYAVSLNMITIINTHHDERLISLQESDLEQATSNLVSLWSQIGERFAGYDHFLIFEGMNEPRTVGSPAEWGGGTPEEHAVLNILNQAFVDTIRSQGGNNPTRVLMVPTYAAAAMPAALSGFELPTDPTNEENKLIVSIHTYAPYWFALHLGEDQVHDWSADNPEDTGPIEWHFSLLYDYFISQGIPVIIGEMGTLNRDNTDARVAWTYFYTQHANSMGIPVIWWDNGRWDGTSLSWEDGDFFGIFDRETNTFPWPEIIDALLRGSGLNQR